MFKIPGKCFVRTIKDTKYKYRLYCSTLHTKKGKTELETNFEFSIRKEKAEDKDGHLLIKPFDILYIKQAHVQRNAQENKQRKKEGKPWKAPILYIDEYEITGVNKGYEKLMQFNADRRKRMDEEYARKQAEEEEIKAKMARGELPPDYLDKCKEEQKEAVRRHRRELYAKKHRKDIVQDIATSEPPAPLTEADIRIFTPRDDIPF